MEDGQWNGNCGNMGYSVPCRITGSKELRRDPNMRSAAV